MDGNLKLIVRSGDFVNKKNNKGKLFDHLFRESQHHIMHVFCDVPTQVIRLMLLEHVFDFEKMDQILEGFIISHRTIRPQQIKYDNKLNLFIFLLTNPPQNISRQTHKFATSICD
jgi:hypothetical protein